MDLGNLLRVIGRRAPLIVACIIAAMLFAAVILLKVEDGRIVPKSSRHLVTTEVLVDIPDVEVVMAQGTTLRLLFAPVGLAEWVESRGFAEEVAERVGGAYTPDEVLRGLNAFAIVPTQLLHFDVYGASPEDAEALAWASVATFQDLLIRRQGEMGVAEGAWLETELLNPPRAAEAVAETSAVNSWLWFAGVFGATAGLVLAFGLPAPDRVPRRAPLMRRGETLWSRWRPRMDRLTRRWMLREIGKRAGVAGIFLLAGVLVTAWLQVSWGPDGLEPKKGRYRASARLMIDMPAVDASVANHATIRLLLTPSAHEDIVKSEAFAREVSDRVGGVYDVLELGEQIEAKWVLATSAVRLETLGDTPEDALVLLGHSVDVYQDWLTQTQDRASVPESRRLVAEEVDAPTLADVRPEATRVYTWLVFGAVAGGTLGAIVALTLPFSPRPGEGPVPGRRKRQAGQRGSRAEDKAEDVGWHGEPPIPGRPPSLVGAGAERMPPHVGNGRES